MNVPRLEKPIMPHIPSTEFAEKGTKVVVDDATGAYYMDYMSFAEETDPSEGLTIRHTAAIVVAAVAFAGVMGGVYLRDEIRDRWESFTNR